MDLYALVAFYFLFALAMLVNNIIIVIVVISRGLARQRCFLLLLNIAVADVIYAICLIVQTAAILVPVYTSQRGVATLSAMVTLLPSVVQVSLVLVNVSYVLETRKEHARLNGSRLVAGVMVASPWLYALLVVTPLAASTLGYSPFQTGATSASPNDTIGLLVVAQIIPGFFACIATTLAVMSYVSRDRQEGSGVAPSAGDATPMHGLASTQSGGNSDQPQGVTSAAPETTYDVTAEPRSPKAEVVYTSVSVGLLQLTIYIVLGIVFTGGFGIDGLVAAAFIGLLRPAFLCWLWNLRPDFKMAARQALCCCRQSGPRYH